MARDLYSELASLLIARRNCAQSNNTEWFERHSDTIEDLVDTYMPRGSGFDRGTKLDVDASHANKLIFNTSYHHMDEMGGYDGWTEHTITVTPSLTHRFHVRISGRNRNNIKDYMHDCIYDALTSYVTYTLLKDHFPQYQLTYKWEDKDGNPSQCYMAWYVNGERFWNDPQGATDRASELMEAALIAR